MATADITVIGLRTGPGSHASEYIAEIQRRLAAQDKVTYELHGMGTSLQGAADDIFAVAAELHKVPFEMGVPRVYTVLKLDDPKDRPDQTLTEKVRAVEARI
ncbi:MAG: MTH1187 family thiamine-binding protein [Actinobacteria bacterium]|nr:MTH1187 family thiamine-binding protein [Actinomycetota bacterium]